MSDVSNEDRIDLERIDIPGQLATFDPPPSIGWVVHEVVRVRDASQIVWAWCKVEVNEPGYTEVTFTKSDGSTKVDIGTDELRLGPVLFQVWC